MQHKRVQNIFKLVDYLHSEIKTFNDCENLISEIQSIKNDLIRLEKSTNFFDKTKVVEYKKQLPQKIEIYDTKIITPISNKLIGLELYDPNRYETVFNDNQAAINAYANDIANVDLEQVESAKNKYLEFRESINNLCFDRSFIFKEADNFLPLLGAVLNKLFLIFSVSEDEKKAVDYSFSFVKAKPNTPPPIEGNAKARKNKPRSTDDRFETIFPDSVAELYEQLNSKGFVKTTEKHFVWAFGIGDVKPTDFNPIVWRGNNTQLAYLIGRIVVNKNKWKVGNLIFGVGGLAQSFKNCNGDPRDKGIIDDIITDIG